MEKKLRIENHYFQYLTLTVALLMLPFFKLTSQVSHLVISQVYGAGGNTGAAYKNDYVEIFNPTGSTISLTGWSLQYAATTGSSWTVGSLSGSIAAGKYFLVSLAGGANGAKLPTADASIAGINMATAAGKIVLVSNATSLSGLCPTGGAIVDFVGFGTGTNCFEGAGPTPSPSASNAVFRASNGCTDTDVNSINFSAAAANPRNSSSAANVCSVVAPTQLVITSITPTSPVAGSGFSVTVQAQDATNTVQNVVTNTAFSLSTNGNAGSIGGTITGTINAGSSSVVISGVTLSTGGTNVNITATRTSGDVLSAATSSTFTVIGLATQLAFVGVPSSGYVSSNIGAFTIEARRADNSVDVNYNGTIAVAKAGGPGTLSGTTSVAAVSGVATFSVLQFDQVGTYSLSSTSGTLTPSTSSSIIISPSPVTWDFTTAAATNIPANLSVSLMSQGNNNGTTALLDNSSVSSGYTGASGANNAEAAARTGVINTAASGSAYFEFTLTSSANYIVTLNGISFGTRSTSTGPQAFSLRSSKDNYISNIASGSITTGSWGLKTPAVTSTSSNAGNAITYRLYGHSGTGSPGANTANWRIDDVLLNLTVSACTQPNISVNSGSICEGNSFTITPTGGVTYSVTGNTYTVSPTSNTNYTVTGADAIGCTNTVLSAVSVNTVPVVSVNSGAICTGNSFTISPSGANTFTISGGANVVSPTTNTDYTVTGTSSQGCISSNQAVSSITVNSLPNVSITGTSTICSGYTTVLTASGANTYIWSNGATTAINNVTPTSNTTYSVIGTNGNGCTNTASVNVTTFLCVPNTSLQAAFCGTTLTSLGDKLKCLLVSGASKYEWEVTDISTGNVYLKQSANNLVDMYLSFIPQVTYNKSYNIRVRAYSGGIWGVFSNSCTVTTPIYATTKLQTAYCSSTLTSLSDRLKCDVVPSTTMYEWEVTDLSTNTIYLKQSVNSIEDMYLSYIPQVTYNKTYSIRVRAYSAGVWNPFGTACNITTPLNSTTKLQTTYCSSTLTALNNKLKCDVVPSTTIYEWEVTDISTNTVYLKQSANSIEDMYLSYIPQVTYNKTYSIRVRAYSAGVWGIFGQSCTVTTPASGAKFAFSNTEKTEIGTNININTYPNPTDGILNIDFDNVPSNASIEIYNMVGELVLTQQLTELNNTINTSPLANGLYHAKVIGNSKLLFAQKIVKQ